MANPFLPKTAKANRACRLTAAAKPTQTGRGIALKSIWDVRENIESGELVELLKDFEPPSESALQVLFPRAAYPIRRVRALMTFLAERI